MQWNIDCIHNYIFKHLQMNQISALNMPLNELTKHLRILWFIVCSFPCVWRSVFLAKKQSNKVQTTLGQTPVITGVWTILYINKCRGFCLPNSRRSEIRWIILFARKHQNNFKITNILIYCPVGWGCRIHRQQLCRRVRPHPNECPVDDTKQSDCEVPVMLGLWESGAPFIAIAPRSTLARCSSTW